MNWLYSLKAGEVVLYRGQPATILGFEQFPTADTWVQLDQNGLQFTVPVAYGPHDLETITPIEDQPATDVSGYHAEPADYPCPVCQDTRDDCATCGSAPDEAAYAADWRQRVDDGELDYHPLQPGFWEPIACHVRDATVGFEALMERPHE